MVVAVVCGFLLSAAPVRATLPNEAAHIPRPPGLAAQVAFWKAIFGTYSTHQVVIHDALHVERVYEVLDFGPLADSGASDAEILVYAQEQARNEKERIRAILIRLHQLGPNASGLSEEERKIRALFVGVKQAAEYLEAAAEDRIRAQHGLRERFAAGVEVSRRYLPEMEAVFRREGLPLSLTRLPLVESCFNVRAYSKVGAAGIWQFMPSTGRLYLRVDDTIDERRDPVLSTAAAARHLKRNYEVLGSWPLAITAYNHGRAGMVRAVSAVGSTDLVDIIGSYHGPAFRFASRNFYAEFLAALEVEQHFADYFGRLHPHAPRHTETVMVPEYVGFKALAQAANVDADAFADLNPAFTEQVLTGKRYVPKGYRVRVPAGATAGFAARFATLQIAYKQKGGRGRDLTHRVQRGQTLAGIAKRYRTTVAAIERRNNLRSGSRLRAGQSILIPRG